VIFVSFNVALKEVEQTTCLREKKGHMARIDKDTTTNDWFTLITGVF